MINVELGFPSSVESQADMGTKLLRLCEGLEAKASASASWFQKFEALASASAS